MAFRAVCVVIGVLGVSTMAASSANQSNAPPSHQKDGIQSSNGNDTSQEVANDLQVQLASIGIGTGDGLERQPRVHVAAARNGLKHVEVGMVDTFLPVEEYMYKAMADTNGFDEHTSTTGVQPATASHQKDPLTPGQLGTVAFVLSVPMLGLVCFAARLYIRQHIADISHALFAPRHSGWFGSVLIDDARDCQYDV
jgi:hypothetical protein